MKQQNEAALFAHLQYEVLHQLEISIAEYWFLDMVYQLSRDGWCYKSLESIANDMRITKNGVLKLRDRLIARELVIKDRKGRLKTSVMYNSVYRVKPASYNSVQNRYTKYTQSGIQSSTKNNKENNKEKKAVISKAQNPTVDGPGRAYALQKLDEIKRRKLDRFGLGVKRHA